MAVIGVPEIHAARVGDAGEGSGGAADAWCQPEVAVADDPGGCVDEVELSRVIVDTLEAYAVGTPGNRGLAVEVEGKVGGGVGDFGKCWRGVSLTADLGAVKGDSPGSD